MKIHELIYLTIKKDYTIFATDLYSGLVKIAMDKIANFENAVKSGRIDADKWDELVNR